MPSAKELDKFYTKPETAKRLIGVAAGQLGLDLSEQLFLEPSAGSGAFSSPLEHVLAYDLAPEGEGIEQADFLTLEPSWGQDTVAMGNPPFGYKAKLATSFINRCAESCDAVCFILPNTFRRYNTQSKVADDMALIYDETLPVDSFTYEGQPYSLRCVFQIWVRIDGTFWKEGMPELRQRKRPPIAHPDFECWQHNATVESRKYLDEDWQLAFWRQGYKDYGHVFTKDEDYDEIRRIMYETNLQLFLVKPKDDIVKKRILSLDLNALASENLATPGFGKADFVRAYCEKLEEEKDAAR